MYSKIRNWKRKQLEFHFFKIKVLKTALSEFDDLYKWALLRNLRVYDLFTIWSKCVYKLIDWNEQFQQVILWVKFT